MKKKTLTIIIIVCLFLSFLSTLLISLHKVKSSFTTISHGYGKEIFVVLPKGEILKKEKVIGRFKSAENNLGIIAIRFNVFGKVKNDQFVFRLKEEGQKKWFYENTYRAKEFGGYPLFPFGFPIIENSKNKVYYFELESKKGERGNAIEIAEASPVVEVRYKFEFGKLIKDSSKFATFASAKIPEIIDGRFFVVFSSIFTLLFVSFTIVRLLFIKRKNIGVKPWNKLPFPKSQKLRTNKKIKKGNSELIDVSIYFLNAIGIIVLLLFRHFFSVLHYFHQWLKKE